MRLQSSLNISDSVCSCSARMRHECLFGRHSRSLAATMAYPDLLPPELRPPEPTMTEQHTRQLGSRDGAEGRSDGRAVMEALQQPLPAGATFPISSGDKTAAPKSWLGLGDTKTARMETIGAAGVCGPGPVGPVDTEPRTASPVSEKLVQEALDVGKGPQSPGSINNGVGLGLLDDEVGEDGQDSRPCSPALSPAQQQPATSQFGVCSADEVAEAIEGPRGGNDMGSVASEGHNVVPHSAAEALWALGLDGHGVQGAHNPVTGVPSQHGMITRDPLRTSEAADLLVQFREDPNEGQLSMDNSSDGIGERKVFQQLIPAVGL